MYTVSEKFKTYAKSHDRTIEGRIEVNEMVFTGNEIVEFTISENVLPISDFTIGTAVSSKLNLYLRTVETIPNNSKLTPYIRFLGEQGESEWFKLGEYYIDSRSIDQKTWKFTCFDRMIYGEQSYISGLSYPATMQAVWDECCTLLGVSSHESATINPEYMFAVAPTGHKLREVLGYIAAAHVASAKIMKNGEIGFIKFTGSSETLEKITAGDYIKAPVTNPAKTITRIVVTSTDQGDETKIEAGEGDESKTLTIYNPYITQGILDDMLATLNGFRYVPYDMEWRCFPYLELGDTIDIEQFQALSWLEATMPWQEADFPWGTLPVFNTVLMANTISFKGGLKATSSASAASAQQSETKFQGSLSQQIKQLDKTSVKEGKNYYGVTINREDGVKVQSTSGGEAVLNGDEISLKANGEDRVYFDAATGKYKFKGTLEATDGVFSGTVYAANISTLTGRITAAQIETLEVGTNVNMGPYATINWNQVTGSDAGALDAWKNSGYATHISASGLYTGAVYANQIYGEIANLSQSVNIGNPYSYDSKSINFYNIGSQYTRIRAYSGGGLELMADNAIDIRAADTINLYTVNGSLRVGSYSGGGTDSEFSGNMHFDYGTVKFEGDVEGLVTDEFTQGNHNHGISPGTRLAIVNTSNQIVGSVVFSASGGFTHSHWVTT